MNVYRACTDRDLPALQAIWLTCFDEREDAAELFLRRNLLTCHAYGCETDSDLVAAVYLIDCTLGGAKAHYLCGAATLPAYRNRGIMAALIGHALKDAADRGDRYSLLQASSDSALIWEEAYLRFAAEYYGCYGAQTSQSADAFAIWEADKESAEVIFAVYRDVDALKALLRHHHIRRFSLSAAADSPLQGEVTKPYGMILPLNGDETPDNAFIGVTLQ